ncbi:hypothetical protein PMAYCL1PPCAC_17421, partial [Pristionchus mayeri]
SFRFLLCLLATIVDIPDGAEARENLASELNTSYVEGWLIFRMNDEIAFIPKLTLIIFDVLIFLSLAFSVTLASLTYRQIQKARTLSFSDRSMQIRLLIVASVQTFVPFICIFIPYLYVLNVPFLDVFSPSFSDVSTLLHSLFPTLDAIVIIVLFRPYREGFLRLFGIKK